MTTTKNNFKAEGNDHKNLAKKVYVHLRETEKTCTCTHCEKLKTKGSPW